MSVNFSIVLIAKNESKTLPRLIKSLNEFQNRGGEICLIDTGSSDDTPEIAKNLGVKVEIVGNRFVHTIDETLATDINKRFIDPDEQDVIVPNMTLFDYASARNYAATLASNDMIAMPDCDEIYTKFDIDKLEKHINNGAERLSYNFVFSHDAYGNEAIKFTHSKFYNRNKTKWVGIVHEVLTGDLNTVYLDETIIKLEHWQNKETNRTGYLPGLALDCYLHPDNDRNSHYFARELMYWNRPKSAIKEFIRHINMNGWIQERSQSMIYIGDCYKMLGNTEESLIWYNKAFLADGTRRAPLMSLANYFYRVKDYHKAAAYANAALAIPGNNYYSNNYAHYSNEPHEILYWAFWYLKDYEKSKYHWKKALEYQPQNPKYIEDAQFYQ